MDVNVNVSGISPKGPFPKIKICCRLIFGKMDYDVRQYSGERSFSAASPLKPSIFIYWIVIRPRRDGAFFPWERLRVGDCTEVSRKRGGVKSQENLAGLPSGCCFVEMSLGTDV